MLVDIDMSKEVPVDKFILCKLNEEPIQEIHTIENLITKKYHSSIDEISFNVHYYRNDEQGNKVRNEIYDMIDGDMLILMNNTQYFYIDKPVINSSEDDSEIYKSIHCFSREFELSQKKLIGYNGVSRKIYDRLNNKDTDGLEIGYLNYLEKVTAWRVGFVNEDVMLRFRELNFPNSNLLQSNKAVQETFGCLFKYNTVDKIIDVYDATQIGTDKGMYISDENFIQTLEKTIDHAEIKTRLYIYGKDNMSIQSLSVTGKPYLENYDFYKHTKYMSQSLIDGLNAHQTHITEVQGLFNQYLQDIEPLRALVLDKETELHELEIELKVITDKVDVALSTGSGMGDLKTQEFNKLSQCNIKKAEIDTLIAQIFAKNQLIVNINVEADLGKFLTPELLRELDPFIKEDAFIDSNYAEDNVSELYEKGVEVLKKISYPNIQFTLDIDDLLSMVECQHVWNKLSRGDIITIHHTKMDMQYKVRLISIERDIDGNNLNLKFSNRNSVDDANIYLSELIENMNVTSSTVDFSKYKWDKGDEAESIISKYISSNLDLEKQKIMGASNQKPLVDERGIWLVKDVNEVIDPEQTRLVNNAIVMTKDDWNTSDIAISPNSGINATLIRGKLGQFATVQADQIVVGSNGATIPDEALGGSLVKQNVQYNQTKITQAEGIEVFDNLGKRVLQTGGFSSTGSGVKDMYGHVAYHEDGGYSALVWKGFMRRHLYGDAEYLNGIYTQEYKFNLTQRFLSNPPPTIRINLPVSFRGRGDKVDILLIPTKYDSFVSNPMEGSATTGAVIYSIIKKLDIRVEVVSSNFNVDTPYIDVDAYLGQDFAFYNASSRIDYYRINFIVMVVGR